MKEKMYRGIAWSVSEAGRKFENRLPGLGFFFREGEMFPVTPYMVDYGQVVKAILERRKQLKNFGKGGTVVFDIESNFEDLPEQ